MQRRFWEHQIRDEQDYKKHMDYIHYNLVKHNAAKCVNNRPYLTFHRYVQKRVYSENWGGGKKKSKDWGEVCCLQKDRFNSNSVKGGVKNVYYV